jgi:ABC-2 type transport system ATP-binding protein
MASGSTSAPVPAIVARNLTKRFRRAVKGPGLVGAIGHLFRPRYEEKVAVDALCFEVQPGESVAYLGPNGAGKSTTLKLLSGILVPSGGEVLLDGLPPRRSLHQLGAVFGHRSQLWADLPVVESIRLLGDIYAVPAERFRRNVEELVELLELAPLLSVQCRQLSLGQRMRCELAAAFVHSPRLVFLDEPTVGLDSAAKDRIRKFIRRANRERGTTVILTSHDVGDVEDLCDRMVMIDDGRISFDGSLRGALQRFGHTRVLHLMVEGSVTEALAAAKRALPELRPVALETELPARLSVPFDPRQVQAGELVTRLASVLSVKDLRFEEPTIEAILRDLYERRMSARTPS